MTSEDTEPPEGTPPNLRALAVEFARLNPLLAPRSADRSEPDGPGPVATSMMAGRRFNLALEIAESPDADDALLWWLYSRYSPASVRQRIAAHPAASDELLIATAGKSAKHEGVMTALLARERVPEVIRTKVLTARRPKILAMLVARPDAEPKLLRKCARSGIDPLRVAALGNPSTPPDVLRSVARYHNVARGDDDVRLVLSNPALPGDALERIARERPALKDIADKKILARIHAQLGIDPRNTEAVEWVRQGPWWELTRESPEVQIALRVHANP